ncbi:MAG: arginine--tRNA ligase [Actinomycetota bacterium]|jgi:arginyl-tRNA synthetase|nr:arginine--tRNA ligase [Actinomycetota bacterium]
MADPQVILTDRLRSAFDAVSPGADPVVRVSEHADFQANGALALGRQLGRNPRDVAEEIVGAADLDGLCARVEISGPGFVNLTLSDEFLAREVSALVTDGSLGVEEVAHPSTVVVDYSAPNVAKEMHVGNLRSTIIGDALCRLLERQGHRVVRENHIGDWGTPFGMLIEHLVDIGEQEAAHELSVGDLNRFYQAARSSFDSSDVFAERSRRRVVLLQSGDPETLRLWRVLVAQSVAYFDEVYEALGVLLTDGDIVGESFYNPMLPGLVDDLERLGLLVTDDGARCVFPPGFTNRRGEPLPLIVQKSDGGYGYAATDLAAIRDRVDRVGADRILYVVGAPQSQHLSMCFAVARMAGWLPELPGAPGAEGGPVVEHVAFGSVLGPDGKMFKTRSGESVKLAGLLREAVERAGAVLAERGHDGAGEERGVEQASVARAVGIGAVKYADLSSDRLRDYVFDWDRMLAFEGSTGPYLQYAHARICSIFRRAGMQSSELAGAVVVTVPPERELALGLLGYGEAVRVAAVTSAPSRLCTYLYELASSFTSFYEQCPVLNAADPDVRVSRLLLSGLTARVLADGLGLLGIAAPEKM